MLLLFLALPGLVLAQPARNRSFGDRSIRNLFGRFDARIAVGPKSWDARYFACESRVTIVDGATGKSTTLATDSALTFYDIRDDGSGRLIVYAGNSQGGVFQGTYYFLGENGKSAKIPMDIDGHDMLVEADRVYVMKYVPEVTRLRQNLHLELFRLDTDLRGVLWSWRSRGRFDPDVSTFSDSRSFPDDKESVLETAAKRALIYLLSPFEVKYPIRVPALGRQLRLPSNDYIHANTIIRAPNGLRRPTQGSVRLLDENHILVGWGGVLREDSGKPQRGVSIFELDTGREVFGFDLDAGLDSYNANPISNAGIRGFEGFAFPL